MKKYRGVVSNNWFRISLVAGLVALGAAGSLRAQDPDQITTADFASFRVKSMHISLRTGGKNGTAQASLPGIPGLDSVPNFSGQYSTPGFGPTGKPQSNWIFNTLGNPPENGGTTTLHAPIVPVSLDFRNADGSERFVRVVNGRATTCGTPIEPGCRRLFFDVTTAGVGGKTFLELALESPVFSNANYTSSDVPTQFADAVARAEYQGSGAGWHTLLAPQVKTARTMVINQDRTCGIGIGNGGHCSYLYALNGDGSCCFLVLIDVNVFVNRAVPADFSIPAAHDHDSWSCGGCGRHYDEGPFNLFLSTSLPVYPG
jgi:hypothetical protein